MRKQVACFVAGAAMIAVGCPSPDGPATKTAPTVTVPTDAAAGSMMVKMRAVYNGGGEHEKLFKVNHPLVNGDQIAYYVTADRDAYVYVVQFLAEGSGHLLYPANGAQQLKASSEARVPAEGWLELFGCAGDETAFVVASEKPLDTSDKELADIISEIKSAPEHKTSCDADGHVMSKVYGRFDISDGEGGAQPAPASTLPPSSEPPLPFPRSLPPLPATAMPPKGSHDRRRVGLGPGAPPPRLQPRKLVAFTKRSFCIGRPECSGGRTLKYVSNSYEGEANEDGVVVIEFGFKHIVGRKEL